MFGPLVESTFSNAIHSNLNGYLKWCV